MGREHKAPPQNLAVISGAFLQSQLRGWPPPPLLPPAFLPDVAFGCAPLSGWLILRDRQQPTWEISMTTTLPVRAQTRSQRGWYQMPQFHSSVESLQTHPMWSEPKTTINTAGWLCCCRPFCLGAPLALGGAVLGAGWYSQCLSLPSIGSYCLLPATDCSLVIPGWVYKGRRRVIASGTGFAGWGHR